MKLYAPKYYGDFKCIADKCEHNCCTGWEIDIDNQTLKKYKKLIGGYGDTVKNSISVDGTPHFVLGKNEKCPHLDKNGLCKIILNLGEEYLCDICKNHPRFYNYTEVCEVGIGMSCPEAARVILSCPDYTEICEIGKVDAVGDDAFFDGRGERERVYKMLNDTSLPYTDRLNAIYEKYSIPKMDGGLVTELLSKLEYLDAEHKKLFMNYSAAYDPCEENSYFERFLAYLIYRHCTEAESNEDFAARLGFCLLCERLFASLINAQGAISLNDTARLASIISEEIEYSEDNTFMLTY